MSRRPIIIFATVIVLVTAACGTRLDDRAFQATSDGGGRAAEGVEGEPSETEGGVEVSGTEESSSGSEDPQTTGGPADPGAPAGPSGPAGAPAAGPGRSGGPAPAGGPTAAPKPGAAPAPGANAASDAGVTANSITVGNITAVNGPLGDAFARSLRGAQAYFAQLNERGGVNGRKINFLTCDDKEDKTKAAACAKDLIDNKKIFAFAVNNTRALGGAATLINNAGVPDVASLPITQAYNRFPHLFSLYGSPYPRDGKTVGINGRTYGSSANYQYFKDKVGVNKAAIYYYDIDESRQAGQSFKQGMELSGMQVVYYGGGSERGVNLAAPSFDTDVINMQRAGVEGIWDAMDDAANRRLCAAMDRYQFKVKAKVSTIVAWGQSVGTRFSSPCRDSVWVVGSPGSMSYAETGNPRIADFRAAMKKFQPNAEVHQWAMEGYFGAEWFVEGVKTMGASPTRAGLEKYFNSVKGYTANGVFAPRDFQKEDFNAPTSNDCFTFVQWQDAAKTFVTRSPFPTCITGKRYSSATLEDGT